MRVGITLPQFVDDPERALATAARAEAAGLDGVFVFDHLWPIGAPHRPAVHSLALLGALAVETERLTIGTLVARVGLLPDDVLVSSLVSAARLAGGRLVAGLGTGDALNKAENDAFGIPTPPAAERLSRLGRCCDDLRAEGVRTWAGGRSAALRAVAAAHADGWNGWAVSAPTLAAEGADVRRRAGERPVEVTWGGQVLVGDDDAQAAALLERHGPRPGLVHGTVADLAAHFRALAEGGTSWAVCAPLDVASDPDGAVARVARAARSFSRA